jgi:hypothetical protein
MRRINLKEEVVKEICKIDTAMERIVQLMQADKLGVFKPWTFKMVKNFRFHLVAYGGLLAKELKWEREDYLTGACLPIKLPKFFTPASIKKAGNE